MWSRCLEIECGMEQLLALRRPLCGGKFIIIIIIIMNVRLIGKLGIWKKYFVVGSYRVELRDDVSSVCV